MTDIDDARVVLSEMIEITEKTIDRTFHRHADLDAMYRECPTAFWLAPDGGGVLPPPPPGPVMRQPAPIDAPPAEAIDPPAVHGLASAIGRALIAAGPIFAATALAMNQAQNDQHWWDPFVRALETLFIVPITVAVGAVLALLPVLIGVLSLGEAGTNYPTMRRPAAWALTGGLMGAVIAAMFDAGGGAALAIVATSIACASIARTAVAWTDPEFT